MIRPPGAYGFPRAVRFRMEDIMQSSLHDIVNGLMIARTHATLMAEQWPHHARTLNNFHAEITQVQYRLVSQLRREGLYGRDPYEAEGDQPVESS